MKDMRQMVKYFMEIETDENRDYFDYARAKSSLAMLNADVFIAVFKNLDPQPDVVGPAVLFDLISYLHTKSGPEAPSIEELRALKAKKAAIKKELREQKKVHLIDVYIADSKIKKNGLSPKLKDWNTAGRMINTERLPAVPPMTVIKKPLFGGKAGLPPSIALPDEPALPPPPPIPREGKIRLASPPRPSEEKYPVPDKKEEKNPLLGKKDRLARIAERAAAGGPVAMSEPKSMITGLVMPAPSEDLLARVTAQAFGGGIPSKEQLASMIKLKDAEALPSFSPKPFFFDSKIPRRPRFPLPPVPSFEAKVGGPAPGAPEAKVGGPVAGSPASGGVSATDAFTASTEKKFAGEDEAKGDDEEKNVPEWKCLIEKTILKKKFDEFEEKKKTDDTEMFKKLSNLMVYEFISKDPKRVEDLDKYKNKQLKELQDLVDGFVSNYP